MSAQENQVTYMRWLAVHHPALYNDAIRNAVASEISARQLGYLDEDEQLGWINFVVQAVATVGSAVIGKKQIDKQVGVQKKALALSDAQASADRAQAAQIKLLEVNTDRAQRNLPPVDIRGVVINPASLPLPAALRPYSTASATWLPGVPNYVTIGAGGALAFLLARRAGVL